MSSVADELKAALDVADEAVLRLEHAVIDAASVPNRKDVELSSYASAIEKIQGCQARLKVALTQAIKALSMRVSKGEIIETDQGISMERKDGANRKSWQHDQLRAVVAEHLITKHTNADGVLDAPLSVIIVEALKFPSISGWKVTELREAGINPDSYCVKKDGTISFNVVNLSDDKTTEGATSDDDFI